MKGTKQEKEDIEILAQIVRGKIKIEDVEYNQKRRIIDICREKLETIKSKKNSLY